MKAMTKERRAIRDSFPPVDHLDREKVRDTFVRLREEGRGQERSGKPSSFEITASSSNIFADLNLPNPDQLLAKADLVWQISSAIDRRGLTHAEAAETLGTNPQVVANLVHGRLRMFSLKRLKRFLNRLDQHQE
jgi:predicted XRE-type DNA-binding protein